MPKKTIKNMPALHLMLIAMASIASTACRETDSTANAGADTKIQAERTAPATRTPVASDVGTPSITETQEIVMDKTCGATTLRISHGTRGSDANSTILRRISAAGDAHIIKAPDEMQGYTAVGLGCATSTDGDAYFVVQYGELPYGCQFCEWFYLYDAEGKQLTNSRPPILTDTSLPEGEQQSSNTREYQEMIKKLGITHPEVEYIK